MQTSCNTLEGLWLRRERFEPRRSPYDCRQNAEVKRVSAKSGLTCREFDDNRLIINGRTARPEGKGTRRDGVRRPVVVASLQRHR